MVDITKMGINPLYIDTKAKEKPQFNSFDAALDAANHDAGDEAIVAVTDAEGKAVTDDQGNQMYAVIDLKPNTKAEYLFDPSGGVSFGGLVARANKQLEVVSNPAETQDIAYNRTLSLAKTAVHDNVSGLKSSEAYDQTKGRMPTLQGNLVTVMNQLKLSQEALTTNQARLTAEIRVVYDISSKPPATIEWE